MLFVITVAATVSLSSGGGSGSIYPIGGEQTSASSVFSSLLAAFQDNQQFNISGKLCIETGDTDIDIDVFLNADISEGSNMKFEGLVNIGSKAGKTLEFSYIDNTAYLYFSKNSLKLSGSSIGDIVDFVKEFITPAEGESGEVSTETQTEASGSDAINSLFDTNELMQKLMASLENVVETELEGGGKELALSVEGLADLKVNIDSEERPTRAVVKTEEIAGVKLSAEVNIGFTDYIIVSNPELMHPERDYVEAGKVLELVKDTIKTKGLTLDISAAFDGKDLGANLVFDFETKNLFVRAQDKYSLGYLEGDIFADIDGAKIKIAKSLIDAFPDMKGDISKLVGKENFNLEDIGKLTGKLSSLDLLKVLACISDINSSSSGITIILDGEPININGQVRAFVGIEDGKISSVNVGGTLEDKAFELDIKVSTSASEIEIDKDSYLDIEKLISVNKDYFAGKQFALDFALELGGKEDVSFAGTLTAKLDTNYFDLSVSTSYKAGYRADIVYNGEMLYASLNNIMVKLPQSAISELLDKFLPKDKLDVDGIKDKLAERAQDIDIKTLIEKIKYIREFKVTSDGLKLVLSGEAFDVDAEVCLEIGLSGNMLSLVDVSYTSASGEFVHLTANVLSGEIKEKAVDEGKYLDLDAVYNNLKALDLRKGRVSAIASATYNGKDYDLGLNFAGSLDSSRATLVLDLGGEYDINLEVDYFNDDAYIRLGDIYVKVPKDLAKKLLSMASLPEKDKITEKVKESDLYKAILDKFNNFDISMLEYVKDVKVNSSLIEATIGSELTGLKQDVVVFVRLSNNQISGIEVVNFSAENLDLYLKASISFDEPTFRTIDQSKYLDLYPIYDEIDRLLSGGDINIADYLKNNSLAIDFALDLGGNENMSFEGSLSANLDTNYFDISAKTSYKSGYDAQLVLKGGVLYASLNNIMVKLPQSAISELLDKYLPKDKLDINGIKDKLTEQTSSLDAKAIIEILKSVKKLEISSDGLKLTVDGAMFNKDAEVTIAVTLCAGSLTHLDISYVENNATSVHLAVDFLDGEVKEKSVDENEYLDINEVYENLKSLGLRKGSVSLGTNFNYDGKSYSASVNFAGSLDSSRASLVFNLGGAYRLKLEIDYFNDDAFVRVGDAYIKVPKELIEKLLSSVTLPERANSLRA